MLTVLRKQKYLVISFAISCLLSILISNPLVEYYGILGQLLLLLVRCGLGFNFFRNISKIAKTFELGSTRMKIEKLFLRLAIPFC